MENSILTNRELTVLVDVVDDDLDPVLETVRGLDRTQGGEGDTREARGNNCEHLCCAVREALEKNLNVNFYPKGGGVNPKVNTFFIWF